MTYSTKDLTQLPTQTSANSNSRFLGGFVGDDNLVVYTAASIDDIIPDKATEIQITSSGDFTALTTNQQNSILKGALVILSTGSKWLYSGTGDKTLKSSYISLTDAGTW